MRDDFEWWANIWVPAAVGVATVFLGTVAWWTSHRSVKIAERSDTRAAIARIDAEMPKLSFAVEYIYIVSGDLVDMDDGFADLSPRRPGITKTDEELFNASWDLSAGGSTTLVVFVGVQVWNDGPRRADLQVSNPRGYLRDDQGQIGVSVGECRHLEVRKALTVTEWVRLAREGVNPESVATITYQLPTASNAIDTVDIVLRGTFLTVADGSATLSSDFGGFVITGFRGEATPAKRTYSAIQ